MIKDSAKKAPGRADRDAAAPMLSCRTQGATFPQAPGPPPASSLADNYIISSAFNFINNPTTILVPSRARAMTASPSASRPTSRLLTLLKVEAKGLPVQPIVPKKRSRKGNGQRLGRAQSLDDKAPRSRSASTSPGRVGARRSRPTPKFRPSATADYRSRRPHAGHIDPRFPQRATSSPAEWYDSISFAIPMEDVVSAAAIEGRQGFAEGHPRRRHEEQDQYRPCP